MTQPNGRWKFEPRDALAIGAILLTLGMNLGTLRSVSKQLEHLQLVVETQIMHRSEAGVILEAAKAEHTKLQTEDIRIWSAIRQIEEKQTKRRREDEVR